MWYDLGWNTTNYLPEKANGKEDGNCCEGAAIYLSLPTCFPSLFFSCSRSFQRSNFVSTILYHF